MRTHNNDKTNYSAGNPLVEFFGKAGSLMKRRQSYYGADNEASPLDLFLNAWAVDPIKAFQLLLWCRDIRGGAGNRSGSREILTFLGNHYPDWVRHNLALIPEYGRWDDLMCLFETPVADDAKALWAKAIRDGNGLAAKWAPRENKAHKESAKALRKFMGLNPKDYRQLLAKTTQVVETQMCARDWEAINYSHVPSIAVGRYKAAFERHDAERFNAWVESLSDPNTNTKVNAGAVYPHDIVRLAKAEGVFNYTGRVRNQVVSELADRQFEAMPDYFSTGTRAVCVVDMSASMSVCVQGNITAMDVAMGLGIYASDRMGATNPFYRKLIPFSSSAHFYEWADVGFSKGLSGLMSEDIYYGSTNVAAALKLIVDSAKFYNATADQIPNMLLIISDMQFDQGADFKESSVKSALKKWDKAGYPRPRICYWNTAGYAGSPATVYDQEVGLISGFSPAVLSAVFAGEDFTPMAIMERAIAKYAITVPAAA